MKAMLLEATGPVRTVVETFPLEQANEVLLMMNRAHCEQAPHW